FCILRIFSERWDGITGKGAERSSSNWDEYKIKRVKSGWYIEHIVINGECDKSGEPFLFKNLRQDFISYPHNLPIIIGTLAGMINKYNMKCKCQLSMERYRKEGVIGDDWHEWVAL
ncbi:hypothetical protein LCGC14_1868490, partial [marine sediment metagenome]